MACGGCGRNKKTVSSIVQKIKTVKEVLPQSVFPQLTSEQLNDRKKKCNRCPFNISGRCKKGNRMVSKAVIDPGFKCPIKRF